MTLIVSQRNFDFLLQEALLHPNTDAFAAALLGKRAPPGSLMNSDLYRYDRADLVTLLLAHGADPNAADCPGSPPICYAALHGAVECTKALLEAGARVDYSVSSGHSPVVWAMDQWPDWATADEQQRKEGRARKREACRLLLEKGASPSGSGPNTDTPLHLVSLLGEAEDVRLLASFGAQVDEAAQSLARTPLIYAAREGRLAIVQELLTLGADLDKRDSFGYTPEDHARHQSQTEVREFFKSLRQRQALEEQVPTTGVTRPRM